MEEDGQHIEHQHLISITQHVRDVYIICLLLLSSKRTINVQNIGTGCHTQFSCTKIPGAAYSTSTFPAEAWLKA